LIEPRTRTKITLLTRERDRTLGLFFFFDNLRKENKETEGDDSKKDMLQLLKLISQS